jgi:hypothetical protein
MLADSPERPGVTPRKPERRMEFDMFKFALAAAVTFGLANAAFAGANVTATLNTPVAKPVETIAGDTLWSCADKSCVVKTAGSDSNSWMECRKLVAQMGKVSAYGNLEDDKIAMCNAGSKK